MRILVCASEAPLEPLNGMRLQLRALTAELARRHEVCVVGFRWPGQTGAAPAGVELIELEGPRPRPLRRTAERLRALAAREPVESRRLSRPMAAAVERLLATRDFDVAHVTLGILADAAVALDGLPAVVAPLDATATNVRAELAGAHGLTAVWRRAQLAATERHVAHAYRPFQRVVLVTEEDAAATRAADPSLRTVVIPNGVDGAHFRPDPAQRQDAHSILFTGILHTPANVLAARRLAERILPAVQEREPAARLVLAGRDPAPEVATLAGRPGIEVVASPPDLRPLLRGAAVYACPMESGTGIKNKLLEAMACGAACVATPVAAQGLAVAGGEQVLVAATDEEVAAAIARLLADGELRARLGTAAREYVERHHTWDAVARAHEALYAELG